MDLPCWREFFASSGEDIFSVIENALSIAAEDFPDELRIQRDRFAEKMFSRRSPAAEKRENNDGTLQTKELNSGKYVGNSVELIPESVANEEKEQSSSSSDEDGNENKEETDSETLKSPANELESEDRIRSDLLSLSAVLTKPRAGDKELIDALHKLQKMPVTVPLLKATMVGKTVNRISKQSSKTVALECEGILKKWKKMADEWASKNDTGLLKAEVLKEENEARIAKFLPSPPMDESAIVDNIPDTQMDEIWRELEMLDDSDDLEERALNTAREKNAPEPQNPVSRNGDQDSKKSTSSSLNSSTKSAMAATRSSTKRAIEGSSPKGGNAMPRADSLKRQRGSSAGATGVSSPLAEKKRQGSGQGGSKPATENTGEEYDPARVAEAGRKIRERYQSIEDAKKKRHIQVLEPSIGKTGAKKQGNGGRPIRQLRK